jgi:hypothetical protein
MYFYVLHSTLRNRTSFIVATTLISTIYNNLNFKQDARLRAGQIAISMLSALGCPTALTPQHKRIGYKVWFFYETYLNND